MAITRYTTPTISFEVDLDLTNAELWLSLEQGDADKQTTVELTKQIETFTVDDGVTSFDFTLTQEESAMFDAPKGIKAQLNAVFPDGSRLATEILQLSSYRNLLEEVKHYGD